MSDEGGHVSSQARSDRPPAGRAEPVLSFGRFEMRPRSRVLTRDQRVVPLGGRAFEILNALVERAGELVPYQDLLARAWPASKVDESNLKVQIAAIRRALAPDDLDPQPIANVANQGYQFTETVVSTQSPISNATASKSMRGNLPASLNRIFGRADAVATIRGRLTTGRLVSVVGPGGIGKTTAALEAAQGIKADGVWFIDLATVNDLSLVPVTIARTLGVTAKSHEALSQVRAFLQDVESLIVLDNCEHLIGGSAEIVATLLSTVPGLRVLATSRQPLRVEGEWVCRLRPLETPASCPLSVAETLGYPAVQLFVDRAKAHTGQFEVGDQDAPLVVQVCQRLDGIPLALELAAGAVGAIGLRELAARIGQHFDGLGRGRRTARPRQQTLKATLDWSFELLSVPEKILLSRLGVFSGSFTLDSVLAVCADQLQNETEVARALAELADKSLVAVDTGGETVLYRLLETTKAYAREKLRASDDHERIVARFAQHVGAVFHQAQTEWHAQTAGAWVEGLRHWIGDVRQTVDWAAAPGGDADLGAALLIESSPLWLDLGFLPEFVNRALAVRNTDLKDPHLQMRLSAVAGHAIYELNPPPALAGEMLQAFTAALDKAVALGDGQHEFDILVSQCQGYAASGDYHLIEPIGHRVLEIGRALGRPDADLYFHRIMSSSRQLLGELTIAERHVILAYEDPAIHQALVSDNGFVFDPLLFNKCVDVRLRWMRGLSDQALHMLEEIALEAIALGHMPTYTYALRTVLPMAVWIGDQRFIEGPLEQFLRFGEDRNTDYHNLWRSYLGWGLKARAEAWAFERAQATFAAADLDIGNYAREMLVTFHPGFRDAGLVENMRQGRCGWCAAEIVRSVGVERESAGDQAGALAAFEEALGLARAKGALAWELRAAVSLCGLLVRGGDAQAGRALLGEVVSRFTEGLGSADLRQARRLLGLV